MLQGIRQLLINQGQEENFPGERLFFYLTAARLFETSSRAAGARSGQRVWTRVNGPHV